MNTQWSSKRLHFIGIGGCGMSGLALVLAQLGATVSGSDQKESIFTRSLQGVGIDVTIGHVTTSVPPSSIVIYSSAIRSDNVERVTAERMGLELLHRSELLARLTSQLRTVAICGAHGKTTTSTLLAHVLTACGLDPSYVVGGLPKPPMPHGHAGRSEFLIIEADESDRSLLRYQVDTLIVTNVDLDHVRDGGYQTTADVAQVISKLAQKSNVTLTPNHTAGYFDPRTTVAVEVGESEDGFTFIVDGYTYRSPFPGVHQIENASLVVKAAKMLGCREGDIRQAFLSFSGIARRFDTVGELPSGSLIIDDYAHHPSEVEAVIRAARKMVRGRVLAVFQPHLFSRTVHFASEFAEALALADIAYVEDIYPSRETPSDWSSVSRSLILDHAIARNLPNVRAAPDRQHLMHLLHRDGGPQDVVLVLGAGDIGEFARALAISSKEFRRDGPDA